jgi:hypothetical protein
LAGDPGQQILGKQAAIAGCFAAAAFPIALVCVFGKPAIAGVIDANDDERFDFAGYDGFIGVLAHLPGAAVNKRCAAVK